MLQFNTGKKLEKVFPPDQFDALIDYFQDYSSMAATKADVRESELRLQLEIEKVRSEAEKTKAELKTDIEKVRGEVKETEARLKVEIEKVRAELKADIEKVRAETEKVRAETEKVRAELTEKLEANKHEILKWMMGMMVAQTTLILAALGIGIALIK